MNSKIGSARLRLGLVFLLASGCSDTRPATQSGQPTGQSKGDGDDSDDGDDQGDGDDSGDGDDADDGDGDEDGQNDEESSSGDGDGTGSDGNCALGEAGSFATEGMLNLFGDTIYFAKGQKLPKGRYRVSFEDGCMKYNAAFTWTVNAIFGGDGWWLVGDSTSDRVLLLPGTGGIIPGMGGFTDFEECVTANKALAPKEFDFDGGKLGIYLNDAPYDDNGAGQGGRNPKWKLVLLGECPPDLILL
jgi:hypothetical protein